MDDAAKLSHPRREFLQIEAMEHEWWNIYEALALRFCLWSGKYLTTTSQRI